ncbi:Maf family protein [Tahibacter harae]|uniref:7-methyl-GTP pyrophosphatase n=1 Tax=Tahibacter harae TaxID=2963937 RepID=A0ABT1QKZ7_9GAMM|nr:Maf family nucleotide pyrophosphatase [Tahibacter harae]MCQ4163213.1 Maf family nucleotide pyrophosphatase [Tahibacter harae]
MSTTPLAGIDLVLGSTSRYRAELLARLTPRFRQQAPGVDETRVPGEAPATLAARLARAKARAVAARNPGSVVIGSDQVAALDDQVLGKPGEAARAEAQLAACSGRRVVFHTALCLADARGAEVRLHEAADTTEVLFRRLDAGEIRRYVEREQPLDCAGSFKSEGLGITLFERIDNADPSALVGLPLIALCRLLRAAGIVPL